MLCLDLLWTHSAAVPAVLHVDVVVEFVPHALDAQEAVIVSRVAVPGQRVDEEVLLDAATPRQHQHPTVHPQSSQGVGRSLLALLFERRKKRSKLKQEERRRGLISHLAVPLKLIDMNFLQGQNDFYYYFYLMRHFCVILS